ncbi:MAG: exonuclease SbcCD subunit D C-terminal domain-containing protein [Saprospiraceae bacterium]|nr:exonuclease SbcCD subunit D C-terminal domain-containing protein [Saprospiraceae bacterium]
MKILHTADWHIGKVLHKQSLVEEMNLFLNWLLHLIQEKNVDVLVVSGDIFDIANPSVNDRGVYYRFLSRLIGSKTQVIITGGNHDSVGLIDAPQDILKQLDVRVVGGAKSDLKDELIEIRNEENDLQFVIAAVPFLRDRDLRNLNSDLQFESRTDALKAGISTHYQGLADLCDELYPAIPAMAMGHLYAKGVSISESEREIHIGNTAAVESDIFPERFGYVALGHIHRPQIIGGNPKIRYSGSPIALSFSEKEDQKCVLLTELVGDTFSEPEVIHVPKSRQLKKIQGSYEKVKEILENYKPEFELQSFVEIEIEEEDFSAILLAQVEQLISDYSNHENFRILKSKVSFANGAKDTADLFQQGESIEDLKPMEVFEKLLKSEAVSEDKSDMLKDAFLEIFESVHDKEGT